MDKVAVDLDAAAMLDEVDLQIAGQWVIPVGEGSDRNCAANRVADTSGALALTAEGLLTNVGEQPVDGSRTSIAPFDSRAK
ncbi:hypothetical protein OKW41_004958 [Paraburkholderia sp. UCT70]|uniref:hypothetical protein n=1 Tax=Paraburkholderia sp. UCT70 TaxID=2991068 RepID=UPI003D204E3D